MIGPPSPPEDLTKARNDTHLEHQASLTYLPKKAKHDFIYDGKACKGIAPASLRPDPPGYWSEDLLANISFTWKAANN
eukprot:78934-Pelagomonas_calceolata.AAC.5